MSVYKLSSIDNCHYLLTGDINDLFSNRRSKMALKAISFNESEEGLVIESNEKIQHLAEKLKLVLRYVEGSIEYDGKVGSELDLFRQKEEDFAIFSQKASNIKNNIDIKEDLEHFTKSLSQNLPKRNLYDKQLLSAYHLAFSQNGCNFSVPGAGKTSTVYGAFAYLKSLPKSDTKHVDKLLIIGPLSSFRPWELEYSECFGDNSEACKRVNGRLPLSLRKQYFYGNTAEVTLVNYDTVVSVAEDIIFFLRNNKVMVVLDEAHKIKNTSGGVKANAVMSLARYCTSRVVLTGTPAPNGYEDLANLFHFIWPERDVVKYSLGQLREMTKGAAPDNVKRLIDNLNPYFIRTKKSDLGIPPAVEHAPIVVEMKPFQERLYRFIESRFVQDVSDKLRDIHSDLARARQIRLMQAATNPDLLRIPLHEFADADSNFAAVELEDSAFMNDALRFYEDCIPAKFEACADLVESIIAQNGKVIIWANFIGNILKLQEYLLTRNIQSKLLYGATPVQAEGVQEDENTEETRETIIEQFHDPNSTFKVIIANPFAVAESISLHKACHNAIYLERSFNCTHYLQSKDRIHRYGLKEGTVTNFYYIESKDTVDSVVDNRLRVKEARMNEVIENMPIPLFVNATEDGDADIRAILDDYARRKI